MAMQEVDLIKGIFSALNLSPKYEEHEEVLTSEDAARIRGVELKSGVKALLFTNGGGKEDSWVIVNVPADQKVDQKKVAEGLGWSKGKIRMATETEVEERTGCKIGAVPPFGYRNKIKILVDNSLYNNKESNFNIGLRTHSARVKTTDLRIVFEKLRASNGSYAK